MRRQLRSPEEGWEREPRLLREAELVPVRVGFRGYLQRSGKLPELLAKLPELRTRSATAVKVRVRLRVLPARDSMEPAHSARAAGMIVRDWTICFCTPCPR